MSESTTKQTFLSLAIGAPYEEEVYRIDFDELDDFVNLFIQGYISKRGKDIIRQELMLQETSETIVFLTRLVEVGAVQFISENSMVSAVPEYDQDTAVMVAHCINIAMATILKAEGLDEQGANIFFDITVLYELIGRIVQHIQRSLDEPRYVYSLVDAYLMEMVRGKINN